MLITDSSLVLDREQLSGITMDDRDLMRDIVAALIQDTSDQMARLRAAIRDRDAETCFRLAHYSKGACANVGANRAAAVLKEIELNARARRFEQCGRALKSLSDEIALLSRERL